MKRITVVGAGYVGLITGVCLAKYNQVTFVECDEKKLCALKSGHIPLYEPGLEALFYDETVQENMRFVKNIFEAFSSKQDVVFICVGTPCQPDGSADLTALFNVAHDIGKNLDDYCLVVNKSTVPVGTAKCVADIIQNNLQQRNRKDVFFDVASNPEFLKQGNAVNDFMHPDRIVVGIDSDRAEHDLKSIYAPFITSFDQFITMSIPSSELSKYAANAMLATRISFMNQLARLADKVGANISDIERSMAMDERIGRSFLRAGIGYGGSCLPKDVCALVAMGKEHKVLMSLADSVNSINDSQLSWFAEKIFTHYKMGISEKKIGLWGLSFKPGTDDVRCSPAFKLINLLVQRGAHIIAYDPIVSDRLCSQFKGNVSFVSTKEAALESSDCLVITTEWDEFLRQPLESFSTLNDKVLFDGRNCFDLHDMDQYGVVYHSVGRSAQSRKFRVRGEKEICHETR